MDRTSELLHRFECEHLEPNSISQLRRVEQAGILRRVAREVASLESLTPPQLATFVGSEIARGVTPRTVAKYLTMIRGFYTWASVAGIIDAAVADELKSVSKPRGAAARCAPQPYTPEQIGQFYALMAAKYPVLPIYGRGSRAMIRFTRGRVHRLDRHLWRHTRRLQLEAQIALALELGLRRIEILRLSLAAIHPDNDQVVVLTAKQGPGVSAKRAVPYTGHARQCVHEWLEMRALLHPGHESPWLSLVAPGTGYGVGSITAADQAEPMSDGQMAKLLYLSFGHPWRWHRFRHTAATEWLRAGVPLEKVQLYMGHANIEQTLQYAKIVGADIDAAFSAAEARFAARLGLGPAEEAA